MNTHTLALSAILAFGLLAAPSYAYDRECVLATEHEFRLTVTRPDTVYYFASRETMDKVIKVWNDIRDKEHPGIYKLEADKLLVASYTYGGKEMMGIALFKDGCLVPGAYESMAYAEFVTFMTDANVPRSDYTEEEAS